LIVSNYLLPTEFEYLTGLARCLLLFIGDLAGRLAGSEEGQLDTPHPTVERLVAAARFSAEKRSRLPFGNWAGTI
jgi:hypothetical protein